MFGFSAGETMKETKSQLLAEYEQAKLSPKEGVKGTGETKTRGLALGVETKAIQNKLTETLGDLPEYQAVNIKEQAKLAQELVSTDYDKAKRIAMGEELPPNNMLPESVFVAVEDKAIKENDINTIKDLAVSSGLVEEATTMGQRLRTLAERDPESPVTAIKSLSKARESEAVKKNLSPKKMIKNDVKQIKESVNKLSPTKETWAEFIKSIQC